MSWAEIKKAINGKMERPLDEMFGWTSIYLGWAKDVDINISDVSGIIWLELYNNSSSMIYITATNLESGTGTYKSFSTLSVDRYIPLSKGYSYHITGNAYANGQMNVLLWGGGV